MSEVLRNHKQFMRIALDQAAEAARNGEVPIGCVIVKDGEVLSTGSNMVESHGATRHAEIVAIERACRTLNEKILPGSTLYVTVEPCTMCTGAILLSRIGTVVYGAAEPKTGACGSLHSLHDDPRANHQVVVRSGILAEECAQLMREFFERARNSPASTEELSVPLTRPKVTGGTLYVVPTPIGNVEDITARALKVLRGADIVLCEDTRHTGQLFQRYGGVHARLVSNHDHNERERVASVVSWIESGKNVAMVSDAGMPGISDPGYRTIHGCIEAGCSVCVLPGPSAFIAAVAGSGLSTDMVLFVGFPPQKKGRGHWLKRVLVPGLATTVMYESPYRMQALLADIAAIVGPERRVCVAREISKVHEEYLRGTMRQVAATIEQRGGIKGECVVVVDKAPEE